MIEKLCLTDMVFLIATVITGGTLNEFEMLGKIAERVFTGLILIELAALPILLILVIWK